MSKISVQLELTVSDDLCADLLTTAVEGGSSYWLACDSIERRESDSSVTRINGCHDREDEDTKWDDVTLETMRQGIRRLLSGEVEVNDGTRSNLLKSVVDPDNCNWDADDADCVLQAGLLNDIVYG